MNKTVLLRKIAYCIPALYDSGGMERVLTLKANYFANLGYEVHVIITDGGEKKPFFLLNDSVIVHQLNIDFESTSQLSFFNRIWHYKRKMRIFRNKMNDCLCTIKPDITVSLLRRDINFINKLTDGSLKVGEIHFDRMHYRKFEVHCLPKCIQLCIQKWWMNSLIRELRKLEKFIVLTYEDAENWPELTNLEVIPNPSSFFPDFYSGLNHKQVIAVGRYVRQKGFDRLISAWKIVVDKHPNWVLRIFGDGWMRDSLQQHINNLQIQNECFLEYPVSDIASKYAESSIFVLSSRFEGFGLVIVEAMSCGLPVVAFSCKCGPRDIISNGVDGFLVEIDNIDELAERINELIENDEVRKEFGRNARLKAESYKIDKIGQKWLDLFEYLLLLKS